ncbi:toll-like receptor 4 [Mercenaria mercenaria]|uniref:toll-like receptor 4 n=1 Tax=Mercenaria mercenaria TaxID=6596 RepID=UPI00234FAC2A|nr:toll-like receptor 4 [Mercenaria mercenaria]XP_053378268.1 toll-like receptor 4 [Mercenaria mercenaria]XP_053378269.1 toll-like receptor 4 [Mercenaria mercenaria]XP_053378270.1 toll-like receptor 4 [Mercenaria mercenaria]XP_053378271.1 toll-like receptor 4 [Mercenaria mercenaria]XP_053378272.1 toll-like receptor 4 [Mercenaria mercenaria]
MGIFTYFLLAIFLRNLHTVQTEIIKPTCAFGHLDEKSFSECGNRGYAMRCNDTSLTQIPDSYLMPQNLTDFPPPLCLLDLSYNKFYLVGNQSFVNVKNLNSTDVLWLYLDYSNITFIASNAFENLTNLLYLNLTGNNLNQLDSFGDGVFKPLINLRDLNVKENKLQTFDYIGIELQYLKNLKGIYMDLCADCVFGKNFSKLTNLKTLSLSGRSKNACNAPFVKNTTFQYVPTVESLYMASCQIQSIDKNAFSYLKNITLLDISYNEHLKFTGMNQALYGLRNSSTLKLLNVNRIHQLYESGIQLKLTDIENLKTLRALETLHMDLNKIEVFDVSILHPEYQFPKTLKDLTLSGNRLTAGKYVEYLHKMIGVESLDLSRQHLNYDPFFHEHYENSQMSSKNGIIKDFSKLTREEKCPSVCAVCLPHSLRKVKWRKSFIYLKIITPIAFCWATGLKHVDLSFNLISKWNATIFGLENVTHLDLSENVCDEVDPKFFLRFKSLEHLNLSGNSLGKVFDPDLNPNASKMFEVLKNITKLDLSFNKIHRLPWDIFKNLPNLTHLNLSDNIIGEWNFTLKNSPCLRHLDVSGNKLYYLPESLTTYLDFIAEGNCNKNKNVSVNLYSNPIECTCKTLPFLKWWRYSKVIVHSKEEDTCRLNGENYQTKEHLEQIISILENDKCLDRSWVTWTISAACSVFVCLLTVIVCCTMYRNRWKLRYLYYSRNKRYIHEGFERLFENDAFVSYAKNNASFIKNEMVPCLETQHGLHLWVADRNSVPGTSVAENICHGIYNSRKSILLINKAYLNDSWCDYEMHMAHTESIETKRRMIIIVLMESIPMDSLPVWLMRLLQSERSLEYPEHRQDINTFWMNLADEIQC